MRKSEARLYFVEMGCSHFHMSREHPEKYAQYRTLSIAPEQERLWRREAIADLAKLLSEAAPATEWGPFTDLIRLCEDQADIDSLQALEKVTEGIMGKLGPRGALIAAESLIGPAAHHYESGAIHLAVKLRRTDTARRLVGWSLTMLERAKARNVDTKRVEEAVQKWHQVKRHFKL